ncbi:leupaxin isoform X1 [Syngnathoides biaculeatus]|uniref:leupaxin isoform X1 n=1 Tax=Syngnathoides biaculeatus TaxID=300417 RepID=UPI002ADE22E8|nr:leupaxin isoform X1 [Syngnathoides biaculeatus]XP_061681446.1 leupaxin isoform X1 [Syngnathoides biaculeatus]
MDELDLLLEELALNPTTSEGSRATAGEVSAAASTKTKKGSCLRIYSEPPPPEEASQDSPTIELDSILQDLLSLASEEAAASPLLQEQSGEKKTKDGRRDFDAKASASGKDAESVSCLLGGLSADLEKIGVHTAAKGRCAACNKVIVGKMITAMGEMWHPQHFVCAACKTELSTAGYFEKEGRPYCKKDYEELFAPRCAYCKGPIVQKILTALDQTWHPDHFFCAHCGDFFGDDGFMEKDGKPYCSRDFYRLFAPKCAGCGGSVMENYLTAANGTWHPECFVCADCLKPFPDGRFMELNGRPLCQTHFHARQGTVCARCRQPIVGRCISALEKRFHPEHFVCALCLRQLSHGIFKENNGRPYCPLCFDKLCV